MKQRNQRKLGRNKENIKKKRKRKTNNSIKVAATTSDRT